MRVIKLTHDEIEYLDRQPKSTRRDGGFQSLMVRLQTKVDRQTGELALTDQELERIRRYAFNYGNGGWETRLTGAFSRTLGDNLDN